MKATLVTVLKLFTVILLAAIFSVAKAQPSPLLEACNGIQESSKRLECFKEIFRNQAPRTTSPSAKLKDVVVSLDGALASSLSLSQFKTLRLELAKELGLYKVSPNASLKVVELMNEALAAYTDAEKFWAISLREGGSRGLLSPVDMVDLGLGSYVEKYQIPLVELNWNKWVSRANGLSAIWSFAKSKTDQAIENL